MMHLLILSLAFVFVSCGKRESRPSNKAAQPSFTISGSTTAYLNKSTMYEAKNCEGVVSWKVIGTNMNDEGMYAFFTFKEVNSFIVSATCVLGKTVTNQVINVSVLEEEEPNPVPVPNDPKTPTNPVPVPNDPSQNPEPQDPLPKTPIPTPTPKPRWHC